MQLTIPKVFPTSDITGASGNQKIESWLGLAEARMLFDLSEEGKAILRDRISRHGAYQCRMGTR